MITAEETADFYQRLRNATGQESPNGTTPHEENEPPLVDRLRAALLDTDGLDTVQEPQPLVDGILYRNSIGYIIGSPGHGKTFVSLDIAGCVGTGQVWQTYRVTQGPVLYLVAEGMTGVKQRVRAWEAAMGHKMTGVQFLPVAIQAATADWKSFIDLVTELAPTLIVIDTQARVTVGLEENSAKDMGQFVHRVEQLRIASGACVLIVHHQGRQGDHMRGSTAMEGAADTIVKVTKDDQVLTVACQKQKNAPEFDQFQLRLTPFQDSAVVSLMDGFQVDLQRQPAVRAMLRLWWERHETTPVSPTRLIESEVCAKPTFYRVINTLVKQGVVSEERKGRRAEYWLPRKPDAIEESHGLM